MFGTAHAVRADRSKQGHFNTLISHPEFRDLVIRAAPVQAPAPTMSGQMMRQTVGASRRTPSTPMIRPDPEAVDYAPAPPPASAYDPTQDYRPVGESTIRPLIPVPLSPTDTAEREGKKKHIDWLLWTGVLVVALITSMAAVFLLPLIKF